MMIYDVQGKPLTSAVINTLKHHAGGNHGIIHTSARIYDFIASQGFKRRRKYTENPKRPITLNKYADGEWIWMCDADRDILWIEGNQDVEVQNFSLD